jgi:hypothetical protein
MPETAANHPPDASSAHEQIDARPDSCLALLAASYTGAQATADAAAEPLKAITAALSTGVVAAGRQSAQRHRPPSPTARSGSLPQVRARAGRARRG